MIELDKADNLPDLVIVIHLSCVPKLTQWLYSAGVPRPKERVTPAQVLRNALAVPSRSEQPLSGSRILLFRTYCLPWQKQIYIWNANTIDAHL